MRDADLHPCLVTSEMNLSRRSKKHPFPFRYRPKKRVTVRVMLAAFERSNV
jgi:hypothetical protein